MGNIVSKIMQFMGAALLSALALNSAAATAQEMMPRVPPTIILVPRMVAPEARIPIRLQKVDVRAEVLGSVAHTRIEMVFYNPNERVLEGELQFPLLEGQTVTGFALDINGELRPAVPVEKARGQQVFEDVSRARIDPALLEKTQGNNYKLRVYPLPTHGTRRVVLEFDEILSGDDLGRAYKGVNNSTYRLPLQFAGSVEQLDVAVRNAAVPTPRSAMAVRARLGAERIKVSYARGTKNGGSLVSFSRKNYAGRGVLTIDYPTLEKSITSSETRADQTYFYAEVAPPGNKSVPRKAPRNLGLVWDASGSGAARDHGREFALLDAYFKALGSVNVDLTVARDRAEAPQRYAITNGDWHVLRAALESMAYDGATSAVALSPPGTADLTLLFSDGLCNYGAGAIVTGDAPLYAVNTAASADQQRLRAIAEKTGGRLLNLLSSTPAEAVNVLTHQYARLAGMHSNGAKDLVSASVYPENNRLKIAGILTEPEAVINLDWLTAQGQHQTQQVSIQSTAQPLASLAATRWAALKLAKLEADYQTNRTAIRELGKRFGMVTRETSLIVLDRVEDYVRYEIAPPESMRAEYERQLAQKTQRLGEARRNHLDDIAAKFAQKVAWWEKDYPKGDMPAPPKVMEQSEEARPAEVMTSSAPPPLAAPEPVPQAAAAPNRQRAMEMQERRVMMDAGSMQGANAYSAPAEHAASEASIQLKKWEPDSPYAKRLREAAPEKMYGIYLDERPAYANSTAFFLDAADIFIERGQQALGLRILSNLAEMNLENRQILRILAYRLLQAKQTPLALPILQQVLVLSPDEPQSWRDLGLAYAANAQYQLAVDNLWEVVSKPWNDRFPDIELIALAELNSIVARAPQGTGIDTSRMDARLLRNLPLDVRAVLSWDADNTDIDLWVTDPNNEKVYYAHRLSYQGGTISRDFTGGYGPEEFSLRRAKPGKYRVQAQFYGNRQQVVSGATTLMLRLSTGFGTARQKDENIILRLTGQGEQVDVGTFEVKK